jgi:hypothetical protein
MQITAVQFQQLNILAEKQSFVSNLMVISLTTCNSEEEV